MNGREFEGPGRLLGRPLSQVPSGMTPLTEHRQILMTTGEITAHITMFVGFTKQYTSVDDAD